MISLPSSTRPFIALHVLPVGFSPRRLKIFSSRFTWPSVCPRCSSKAARRSGDAAFFAIRGNAFSNWFSALYRSFSSSIYKSFNESIAINIPPWLIVFRAANSLLAPRDLADQNRAKRETHARAKARVFFDTKERRCPHRRL